MRKMKHLSPKMGLHCDLDLLIDWEHVLAQPRYAGGHEDVLRGIFGPTSEVISWWSEDDYQGTVAIAHELSNGWIVVMTDYYGSCSGCDAWQDSSEGDARKMILDLVHHARVFDSRADAQEWCHNIDSQERPEDYPFESARNLFTIVHQ